MERTGEEETENLELLCHTILLVIVTFAVKDVNSSHHEEPKSHEQLNAAENQLLAIQWQVVDYLAKDKVAKDGRCNSRS